MGLYPSKQNFMSGDPLRPDRPPLAAGQGLEALFRAEQLDQYRHQVQTNTLNNIARRGQTYLPTPQTVKREIPAADLAEPWPNGQVIWMEPSADAGLPHTRPPYYICLSRFILDGELNRTMLHERVHISQRLHPDAWKQLVEDVWDMRVWNGNFPTDIQYMQRLNPDLLLAPKFAWKGQYVPVAIFKSKASPSLTDTDTVWYDIKTKTVMREPPPAWSDYFGDDKSGWEHPYELAAYLIVKDPKQVPAYKALKPRLATLPTTEVQ
jgi:hypothetical protein